jgi:hypothetical protein
MAKRRGGDLKILRVKMRVFFVYSDSLPSLGVNFFSLSTYMLLAPSGDYYLVEPLSPILESWLAF